MIIIILSFDPVYLVCASTITDHLSSYRLSFPTSPFLWPPSLAILLFVTPSEYHPSEAFLLQPAVLPLHWQLLLR